MNNLEYETLNDTENLELNDLNEVRPNTSKSKNETGTTISSIITLSNTLLGSGMLAMPAALASSGLCLGIINIAVFGGGALFGLWLLTRCATYTGRNSSFFSLSMITFPQASIFFDLAISIKCFGVSVSYLIIVGDLMPMVTLGLFPNTPINSVLLTREFWITVAILVVIPLAFMRKLDSMRHTSFISLLAIVYLLFIVVYYYLVPFNASNDIKESEIKLSRRNINSEMNSSYPQVSPKIEYFIFSMDYFKNLPIFVFAFTCHQNILSVYNEMKDNRQKNVNKIITSSIVFGMVLYWIVGICGYLTFGDKTESNIISMYPSTSNIILFGQLSMVIMVILSYPLQMFPCRLSLDKVFYNLKRIINRNNDAQSLLNPNATSLISGSTNGGVSPHSQQISDKKFFFMTLSILICSYVLACSVETLGIVLSIVGATGSTMICYILPGLLYYKLEKENTRNNSRKQSNTIYAALFMFIIGIILMIVCLLSIFLL
ncbi:hypothetical protein BCR32DRAFT_267463 [Anaeromyces robustus]|uniref:Amino acid transporter transmembrane domain-containing protein n=1 Tax=Anaeromyces robustus TaxID=1754192 RepID=A0A1Y1XAC1_9FUNG|nr:hypothetical protein BCR32DRAFT_267463 [Anaeromyces robustus]|eukprot:ORX82679.1 hypothetical protein BCR32DRAFT_267463 [Anaeromyces robustus]